ncbi:hypothetical protein ACFS5M_07855 [Lacinutrix iliipiscaria]|uniref:HTH cro/C1-type domain-containing protein n=1 Tax=Lacinutrix iliipiscaria TaxID=1230532 RepID=A0ABW5WMU5_9FLAO
MLLIKHLGISARQFDISIGTANGYILRMQKNNASVGSDVIERIVKLYPQVNLVWLITGKGDMLLKEKSNEASQSDQAIETYINERLNQKWSSEKKALLEDILKEIKSANNK